VRVQLSESTPRDVDVDALAVPIAAGDGLDEPTVGELDAAAGGVLREIVGSGEHRGRVNEVLPVVPRQRIGAKRLLLYGLGSSEDLDGQRLRYAHHEMVRGARTFGYRRLAALRAGPVSDSDLSAVIEGCVMGDWERGSRQTAARRERSTIDELLLLGFGGGREREVAAAVRLGEATNRARELQNMPPNDLTPESLAQQAREIADRYGLELEVLGPDELRAGGYNLLLGVAAGSELPPRLIRLRHRGAEDGTTLAIIGKGITFDTGGISLKGPKDMHLMKADMAGAAAVLAAIETIAARGIPADVMAVVPTTENMPGGSAQRPGDVVTSANGKTVEITNTDAEGRLVLADAITYAIRQGATHLVDLATLTGAATIAIGHAASAAIASDDELWKLVAQAADRAGDRAWRLPNYPDYRVLLRSKIADLRNSDYGEAGMITGGMFIQEFTQDLPWVHLDIAASSWNTNDDLTTIPRGPTGAGTRLLVHLAELMASRRR
jgi:leucyl aminopeptidase